MRYFQAEPAAPISRLAYHPASDILIGLALEPAEFRRVHAWSITTGSAIQYQPIPEYVAFLAIARRSEMLAFAASSRTGFFTEEEEYETIIHSTQEERQRTLVFPGGRYLTASALSDDGALLATSRYLGTNTDRPTQIDLSISRGERRDARFGSSLRIVEMDFSPDGRLLACVGPDGFTVWDFEHGESILAKPGASGSDIAFSPHQETLAVAVGESVAIWDIVDGHQCALLEGQAGPVQCLDFSADGAILASGGAAGTVDLWDLNEGRLVQTYDWRIGSVSAIAFARDGLTCAAGGADGCIVVWDVDAQ